HSRQIQDDDVDGARVEQRPEGVEMVEVLAGGDGNLEAAAKLGEPGDVEVMDGIFQPRDAGVLEHATSLARTGQGPALRRIHHDPDVGSDRLAHGVDAPGFELRPRLLAETELDGTEAIVDVTLRGGRELVGREAVPEAVARVRRQAVAIAAEVARERL